MGIITLTDRISVSVRAKNETESNSQKRATGRNIANALTSGGNANISDSLADQIGNTSKPTIADEQGREWISMADIIAAGKAMNAAGSFEEKTVYHYAGISAVPLTNFPVVMGELDLESQYLTDRRLFGELFSTSSYHIYGTPYANSDKLNPSNIKLAIIRSTTNGATYLIGGTIYLMGFVDGPSLVRQDMSSTKSSIKWPINEPIVSSGIPINDVYIVHNSLEEYSSTPTEETQGGSLIDWTKPDDEIEEDIRNLHETWDVSEHAGSTTANGTYVLAGPIEFNQGD